MKPCLSLWMVFVLSMASVFAQEPQPAPAVTPPAPAETELRDPFWPPDFSPQDETGEGIDVTNKPPEIVDGAGQTPPPPVNVLENWPALKLRGMVKASDGRYVATIDGVSGIVEAGQKIRITRDGVTYTWTVNEITAKGVKYTKLEARHAK